MDLGIDPEASDWGEWNDGWDKYDEEHWSVYQSVFGGKNCRTFMKMFIYALMQNVMR